MPAELHLIDEFPFSFYGDTFTIGLASNRKLYLPLRLLCQSLSIDYSGQRQRIQRNEAIAEALVNLRFEAYPYENETRPREVSALRLDRLPYWLGTIDANRIKDKSRRTAVIRFQREFADVAWAAFRSQIMPEDVLAELDVDLSVQQQRYHQAMDQAAQMRQDLEHTLRRVDDVEERLSGLEARLEGTDFINPEQGRRYQVMVSLIADLLNKKGKRAGHAQVHAEVKKVFKVPSYMLIPEARFPEVVRFLAGWYARLTVPGTPLPAVFGAPDQKRLL